MGDGGEIILAFDILQNSFESILGSADMDIQEHRAGERGTPGALPSSWLEDIGSNEACEDVV